MPPKFGGAPACPRCKKSVYAAEQATGPGGMWHKACLTCKECNKRLDSTNVTERELEAYCKNCYGKLFGPKGFGFGSTLSTETTTSQEHLVPRRDSITATTPLSSSQTLSSSSPRSLSPRTSVSHELEKAKLKSTGVDLGNACPRCSKAVYFAEQMLGPGGVKYHKMCFRCTECSKGLDSSSMAEKESVLYCRACHGKNFGPKGYGYGGGAGVLGATV